MLMLKWDILRGTRNDSVHHHGGGMQEWFNSIKNEEELSLLLKAAKEKRAAIMDTYAEVTGDKKKKSLEQVFNQMQLF